MKTIVYHSSPGKHLDASHGSVLPGIIQNANRAKASYPLQIFRHHIFIRSILLALCLAAGFTEQVQAQNTIVTENAQPGNPSAEWQITGAGDLSIQGYATDISYNKGETARFKIKTNASDYTVRIYRLGYYQGLGARLQGTATITAALPQAQGTCNTDAGTGLLDCGNWDESAHWDIPATAVSGVYIARLTRADTQGASHVVFIVRDDMGTADLLFQTSDATWQAYNVYGDANNGKSLYTGVGGKASKVSYNRPFITRDGGGGGGVAEDWVFNAEYPMIRWLEANGYDVSYSADVDTDRRGSQLTSHKVFMSVGHDEYWSGAARANVAAARAAGHHLAFFSGNEVYWKTRWENSYRTLVCYKEGTLGENTCGNKCDPSPTEWTGLWRDGCNFSAADGCRPENELSGQISWNGNQGALTVPASYKSLRFWRNTSVATLGGESAATFTNGTLGYEWDPEQPAYQDAYPSGRMQLSQTVLGGQTHHLSLYKHSSGAWVFGAGTVQWSWGLDANHDRGSDAPSPDMKQATVNLFADMGVQPATLEAGLVPATASTDTQAPSVAITAPAAGAALPGGQPTEVAGTAADAGANAGAVAGVEVSTDNGAHWLPATGTTSWTYSWTPTTQGPATIQSRAFDDSGNMSAPVAVNVTVTAPAPLACPCTVFQPTAAPTTGPFNDSKAIQLGMKFRSSVSGFVTGVRFYKPSTSTGTHIGQLYASTGGAALATATFTNETASGWQQVAFTSPVAITAGTTYVISYHSSTGVYSADDLGFTSAIVNRPLTGLATSDPDGPNGVYAYTVNPAFPSSSYQASNYFVDVVFDTKVGPDTTPPTVVSTTPADNATAMALAASISITFSEALDPASVSGATLTLLSGGTTVAASVNYDASSRTARLVPTSNLSYATTYTVTAEGGSTDPRLKDLAGNALAASYSWSFTTRDVPPPPPNEGPGGPILVLSAAANPFSRFPVEILRAEGFNEFAAKDIAEVRANTSLLSSYDVIVLGAISLTAADVSTLTNWVTAGGTLIAFRPDVKLASLLGITPSGGTLADKYLLVNTTSGPGTGIVGQTMQFHGEADLYTLNGATRLATFYTTATAATAAANPAVTQKPVGSNGGSASAFTYDLARSVVYTRQGNPAWAGQKRDGQGGPIRSDDLFFPDWIDFNKVAIPQADEQQRLLANLITQGNLHRKPLPRFWYLPRGLKAAVVMTGDDHGNGATKARFDSYVAKSTTNTAQAVADWTAIRSTSYLYPNTPITDAEAAAYEAEGFEISLHLNTNCEAWTPTTLREFFDTQLAALAAQFPSISAPTTHRTHCISWSDWASQPLIEQERGIRLDANYYYWPGAWVQDRPGLFTGSGLPMRFADTDGTLIDCYQATTQLTDESNINYAQHISMLLDNALGPQGYYGVFTANMHTDLEQVGTNSTDGSNTIIAAAQQRQVPVISARQLLTWLDGRNNSFFSAMTWSGNTLNFGITAASGAINLRAMLPRLASTGQLSSLTVNGSAVAYTTETIKGISYAFFPASTGTYVATYVTGTCTAPTATIEAVAPEVCVGSAPALRLAAATSQGPFELVVNNVTYSNVSVGHTFASFATGEASIWANTGNPINPSANDSRSIEVGTKFQSSTSGVITGIRFYKGVGNTGQHVGSLWSSDGTRLATVAFDNETASGWQEVRFASSVAITANTTYIASYFSPGGGFAISPSFFAATGVSNGPLTALPASAANGVNGVFRYDTSGFPDGGNTANYWVDVLFVEDSPTNTQSYVLTSITNAGGCTATGSSLSTTQVTTNPMPAGTLTSAGPVQAGQNISLVFTASAGTGPFGLLINGTNYPNVSSGGAFNTGVNAPAASSRGSIWSSTTVPGTPDGGDATSVEVGVKFSSAVAGEVTGIRFYKAASNTGTHTGTLWSSTGTLLATATFTAETTTGWQEVLFSTPVSIAANTTYVASYYTPVGHYAFAGNYFTGDINNGSPLTTLASTPAQPNGVYRYGGGGLFPTNTYNSTNYWVDVAFTYSNTTTFSLTSISSASGCVRQGSLQTLTTSAAPLPVELTDFTATTAGPAVVRLAWTTASEQHNAGFTVERSADGRTFTSLGVVAGAGTSSVPRHYGFLDETLPAGTSRLYYRLRQTDLDGASIYSPVRSVALTGTSSAVAQLLAYPSPAHEAVRVRLLGPPSAAPLALYDALGRLVRTRAAPAIGTETVLPLTELPTGLYVLRCGALSQRLTIE